MLTESQRRAARLRITDLQGDIGVLDARKADIQRVIDELQAQLDETPDEPNTQEPAEPAPLPPAPPAPPPPVTPPVAGLPAGYQRIKLNVDWGGEWWSREYAGSDWGLPWMRKPYQRDNIKDRPDGIAELRLTAAGGAQVRRQGFKFAGGLYSVIGKLPKLRSGVITCLLWGHHEPSEDEIDLEHVGVKGLQTNVFRAPGGDKTKGKREMGRIPQGYAKDFSGQVMEQAIEYRPGQLIRLIVNGEVIQTVRPQDHPTGELPTNPLTIFHEMYDTTAAGWAGEFTPPGPGEDMIMELHGYRYVPLSELPKL